MKRQREINPKKNKWWTIVALHPLTNVHPIPKQPSAAPDQLLPVYIPSLEHSLGQFGSAVFPPAQDTATPWAQSKHCWAAAKHHFVTNIILKLLPKHSTAPATENKLNSTPAETRTLSQTKKHLTVCFSSHVNLEHVNEAVPLCQS